MKLIKQVAASLLLSLGFVFLTATAMALFNPGTTAEELEETEDILETCILLGVPTTVSGIWLVSSLHSQGKQEKEKAQKQLEASLRSTFYQLVQQGQGEVTLMGFAIASQLEVQPAQEYLNRKAKEFNATFKVNDNGRIIYHFDL